jgi:hypothetical protein
MRRRALTRLAKGLDLRWTAPASRDQLHERHSRKPPRSSSSFYRSAAEREGHDNARSTAGDLDLTIIGRDVLASIASSRNVGGMQALIPGVTAQGDQGGLTGSMQGGATAIHGWRSNDSRIHPRGCQRGGGRAQVYELDFGRGNRVVTHVLWADPDADAR